METARKLVQACQTKITSLVVLMLTMLLSVQVQAQFCFTQGVTPTASNDAGYSTCFDSKLLIPFSQLLANDMVPGGNATIISAKGSSGTGAKVVGNSVEFDPKNTSGYVTFTYTIKQNDGVMPFNGHYYKWVNSGAKINEAKAWASQSSYLGMQGYLATITSQEENSFIKSNFNGDFWVGCSNAANPYEWRWTSGPEGLENGGLGQLMAYKNWALNEPPAIDPLDPFGGTKFVASLNGGNWISKSQMANAAGGYLIEYGGLEAGCAPEVTATATVTVYVNPKLTLAATQQNTCSGGRIGSANVFASGGQQPYSYDHFSYNFSDAAIDANMFNTSNGNYSSNGTLAAQTVNNFSMYQNSIATKMAYADMGFLRLEGCFKMESNSNVLFGMAPANVALQSYFSMPFSVNFNAGFISTNIAGTATGAGGYDAGVWYDVKIEKKGSAISFFSRKAGDVYWTLLNSGTYNGQEGAFVAASQYFADNSGDRGYLSKNWKLSFNPDMVNLAKGDYDFTVIDALGCRATRRVTIADNINFSVQSALTHTSLLNAADGAIAISTGVNPIASMTSASFSSDFGGNYNASLYNILGSLWAVNNNEMKGSKINDATSLWRNSLVTNQVFADNGYVSFTGSAKFEANTRAYVGFATTLKTITNEFDMPISFSYKNGMLFYNINGVPTLLGAYAAGTWYDFKIEKAGNLVKFFVKKGSEDFKMVGIGNYAGGETAFRFGVQYYGQNGNFGAVFAKNLGVTEAAKLTGLKAGNYVYTVTSEAGCSSDVSFSIFDPLTYGQAVNTMPTCFGSTDGKIAVTAMGGKTPYQYSVNGGTSFSNNATISNLSAGSYQVVVKDALGNTTTPVSIELTQPVKVTSEISASGITDICAGASVTLTGVTNAVAPQFVWSTTQKSTAVSINKTGNYTVKVTDASGCSTTSEATTVTVHNLPVASITTNADASACMGLKLTAETSGIPGTYQWTSNGVNNGTTSSTITFWPGNSNETVNVKVTNPYGCSSTQAATFAFVNTMLEVRYTMVVSKEINLGELTKVSTGSIASTGLSGKITLGKNVEVNSDNSFVRAKSLSIDKSAKVLSKIQTPAPITMPDMLYNTSVLSGLSDLTINTDGSVVNGNFKKITVKKGKSVTLTGSVFGEVQIQDGAEVTFTNTDLNMDKFTVQNNNDPFATIVHFAPNTELKIRGDVLIEQNCDINPEENLMTMYVGTINNSSLRFEVIGYSTSVKSTVYLPRGTIKVTSDNVLGIAMKGLFIAENITSTGKAAVWSSYTCTQRGTMAFRVSKPTTDLVTIQSTNMKVVVMNNPTTSEFVLNVKSTITAPITITILDATGKVMERITNVQPGTNVRIGSKLHGGPYFAQVLQGNERQTLKLIKM